jgi:outer membrane biosynthesis protein TonB
MNTNDMITKIKDVLNLGQEVKLEQQTLENGAILEAESFESGKDVFIVTEDEKVSLPVGEYELEDGKILVITDEGVIAEIKDAETTEEQSDEPTEEPTEELVEDKKESYATKEELAEVKSMIEEIKAMLEPKEEPKEELKEEPKEETKEVELSDVPKEVSDALSEPAAEPIVANPESKTVNKFNFAQNRATTTLDRVFQKLNQ